MQIFTLLGGSKPQPLPPLVLARFVRGNFRLLSYLNSSATDRKYGDRFKCPGFYAIEHGLIPPVIQFYLH